ncbi:MAG: S53 family peptidase, partial [Gammaproteobacteria bacterium]
MNNALLSQIRRINQRFLKLNNVAKLKTFLQNVQNTKSPQYRQFLTPAQFAAKYGPTTAQVDTVVAWLKSRGINVLSVSSPNRILIRAEATTEVFEHALGVRINDYTQGKRSFYSSPDAPKLPSAVGQHVNGIFGLANEGQMKPRHVFGGFVAAGKKGAASANYPAPPAQTSAYYRPQQIQVAYDWPDVTNPANAAGVTVAILTAESAGIGTSTTDYEDFWSELGLPGHDVTVVDINGGGGDTGGMIETLLDMEWDGAMGPGVSQIVYDNPNTTFGDFADEYAQFANDASAQVMTTSWGAPETSWQQDTSTCDQSYDNC